MPKKILWILIISIIPCLPLYAANGENTSVITLEDPTDTGSGIYLVNPNLEFYKVLNNNETDQFPPDASIFQRNIHNLDNFGFHKNGIVWFHFKVDTSRLRDSKKWVLFLDYPLLDKIDFYYITEDRKIHHEQSGDRVPFSIREIPAFVSAFYLNHESHKITDYYLRVNSGGPMLVQAKIMREDRFNAKIESLHLLFGIFIGILATLFFYNLMVYFLTKEITFLYYTVALSALDVTLLNHMGFNYRYIFQNPSVIHDRTAPFAIPIIIIFYYLFARTLANVKNYSVVADRILRVFQYSQFLILPLALFSELVSAHVLVWSDGLFSTITLVGVLFYIAVRFKDTMAIFVFIAVSVFLIGLGALFLSFLSLSKWDDSTNYGIIVMTSLEHIFLSWVIIVRARTLQVANLEMAHQLDKTHFKLLQERMKPHFLFNTFTMIYQMIRSGYSKADSVVLHLSDIYRYLSENSQKMYVPMAEDWEFSMNFLKIMQERFKGRVTFDSNFDNTLESVVIPPMSIQPVIENCFKHGMKGLNSLHINITAAPYKKDGAMILVIDNGAGLPVPEVKSRTLDNIRGRLERFYNNTSVTLQNSPSGGVIVKMLFYEFRKNHA